MIGAGRILDEATVRDISAWLEHQQPWDVLRWAIEQFGHKLAIATSFQSGGMAILDMAWRIDPSVRVMTVDSGRLHEETYEVMDRVRSQYGIEIEVYCPDNAELEGYVRKQGINAFYRSVPLRATCCEIRKVNPIKKAFAELNAWVTALRRDQSITRGSVEKVGIDEEHDGIIKVSPLANWTEPMIWDYIHAHDVPYNALYRRGYTSIGCAPCTRAVAPGEDPRAGRWWWESGAVKECGIHHRI